MPYLIFRKILLILGWVIFIALAYKVSTIQIEYVEYDPYQILQIDRVRTVSSQNFEEPFYAS